MKRFTGQNSPEGTGSAAKRQDQPEKNPTAWVLRVTFTL
jgi:hypothetical protein